MDADWLQVLITYMCACHSVLPKHPDQARDIQFPTQGFLREEVGEEVHACSCFPSPQPRFQ